MCIIQYYFLKVVNDLKLPTLTMIVTIILTIFSPLVNAGSLYTYSNKQHNFTLSLTDEWSTANDDYVSKLSSSEREELIQIFLKENKNVILYVKKYNVSSPIKSIKDNITEYKKNTADELYKVSRLTKPVETYLGKKVDYIQVNQDGSIYVETIKTNNKKQINQSYYIWKETEKEILEFHFALNSEIESDVNDVNFIVSHLQFASEKDINNVPMTQDKEIVALENNENEINRVFTMWINNQSTILTYALFSLFLIVTFSILFSFFKR